MVNIDPPAPINPSDKPMPSEATQVSNSFMALRKICFGMLLKGVIDHL